MEKTFLRIFSLLSFLASVSSAASDYSAEAKVKLSTERIVFHTNYGDIAVALYPEVAPKHVAQILRMAESGVFNGVEIYRIEKGFVAQIENFDTRATPLAEAQIKTVSKIPGEFSSIHHRRGHLSMARYDDPNSAESSFSFMLGEASHLDGKYTVFGEVVAGLEILDLIDGVSVDDRNHPRSNVTIENALVLPDGNLASVKLTPAHVPSSPDAVYHAILKIFAILAFSVTVGTPFVKSLRLLVARPGKAASYAR